MNLSTAMKTFLDNSELLHLKQGQTVFELRKRAPACVTPKIITDCLQYVTLLLDTCSLWCKAR